jgi:hypothetical protein
MDFEAEKRALLDHLVRMARMPGAKAHAWYRANDLARMHPEFYGDMPTLLVQKMDGLANDKAAQPDQPKA